MKPRSGSWLSAKVRFPDHEQIRAQLAALAEKALQREPNIQAVYLFGSRASGNFSARSDADLLIILQSDSRRSMDRIPDYLQLFARAPVPVDVFPLTIEEIQQNDFTRRALRGGVLLSARSATA
jgi:predicted nucleotidyltransferase